MNKDDELNQIRYLNNQPEAKYKKIFCFYLASYVDERSSYYFTYHDMDALNKIPIDDRYFYMKHVLDVREGGKTWFNNSCYIGSHDRYLDICNKYKLEDGINSLW